MRVLLAACAVAVSAACTPTESPAPDSVPPAVPDPSTKVTGAPDGTDQCGAARHASLVGKPFTDPSVPPASPLVRHIRPGEAVTEEYIVERLNLYASEAGVIERITCG
jgi:hypothetical protein